MVYPLFQFHFAVLILPIKEVVVGKGLSAYLKLVGYDFALAYSSAFFLFACIYTLVRMARTNVLSDALLRAVPVFGRIRRAFALGRFCATYEMQTQAGVNVMDGLSHAAAASQSALVLRAARKILPKIRMGEQVSPLLVKTGIFPQKMTRALRLGEETGKLDQELRRLTEEFQKEAFTRMEIVTDWLPKLLFLVIALYIGYEVVTMAKGVFAGVGGFE